MIGDHANDVRTAAAAGCRGILLLTGHGEAERHKLAGTPVDAVVADLRAAATHIVRRAEPGTSARGARCRA
jgi:phosphoglycolate phosphatase-like HAD superfamily hydrolase